MKYLYQLFILCFGSYSLFSQSKTELYIEKYSSLAVSEMIEFQIPASITLAQGILESGNGTSRLATEGNNHFGIKCHDWEGKEIYADDDEKNECFRKYNTVKESYRDHSRFLSTRGRYSSLFELEITDYRGWSKGLKSAGYATSPTYDDKLIVLIEKYNLQRFDLEYKSIKHRKLFVSHSYGFPFIYGSGLHYFEKEKYFFHIDLNSSFLYSGISIGGEKRLFHKFYGGFSFTGVYHGFTEDKHSLDFVITPQLTYVTDFKEKMLFINLGAMLLLEEINGNKVLPSFSMTYLIK